MPRLWRSMCFVSIRTGIAFVLWLPSHRAVADSALNERARSPPPGGDARALQTRVQLTLWLLLCLRRRLASHFLLLAFRFLPAGGWAIALHVSGNRLGFWAEIFFVDDSILVDDEGHHAGGSVLRRISHEGEAGGHFAIHQIAFHALLVPGAFGGQDVEVVTAIRSGRAGLALSKTLRRGRGYQRADGTFGLAVGGSPIKTVLLTVVTEDLARVLAMLCPVFFLRRSQFLANADSREFITSNAPVENFFFSGLGAEVPYLALLHQWNRRRPVMRADIQNRGTVRFFHQTMHLLIALNEVGAALRVFGFVSRGDDLLAVRSEDFEQRFFVVILGGGDQGVGCVFRREKGLLTVLLRHYAGGKTRCKDDGGQSQLRKVGMMTLIEVQLHSPHIHSPHRAPPQQPQTFCAFGKATNSRPLLRPKVRLACLRD